MKKLIGFAGLFILRGSLLYGQSGPGGVGTSTSNFLWLKADAGTSTTVDGSAISAWNDQSGNGNHVSQTNAVLRPVFESGIAGVMNGKPLVEFDNDPTNYDYLSVNDNTTLDNFPGFTSFSVIRYKNGAPSGTPRAIYSKRVDPSTSYCYSMFLYSSNKMNFDINNSSGGRLAGSITYSPLNDYIVGGIFNPVLASNEQKIFTGSGTIDAQQSLTGTGISNQTSNLHVGTLFGHTGTSKQFDGYIGELIMFNRAVNTAELYVVNNYLSAKYNIALASNDYYLGDTPGNGDFDIQVGGIGYVNSTNTHTQFLPSVSAGLGLTYVSGFDDGDFVFAGHRLTGNTVVNTDINVVSGGPLDVRWNRTWYIDVTNTATAVSADVVFDLSDGGFPALTAGPATNYKLLYRATNSGAWTIVATASSVSGDQITFSGYSFASNSNDGYYTIATLNNNISPLPVQLLSFMATPNEKHVLLDWISATEINNDFYTVERSADADTWTTVIEQDGAGNSNGITSYNDVDASPLDGLSYYRLKQTDFNGDFTYSEIVPVYFKGHKPVLLVFPNPSDGMGIHLEFLNFKGNTATVTITDMLGKIHYLGQYGLEAERQTIVPVLQNGLPAGTYVVSVVSGNVIFQEKVLVR